MLTQKYQLKALQIDKELGDRFHVHCLTKGVSLKHLTEKIIIKYLQQEEESRHDQKIHTQIA